MKQEKMEEITADSFEFIVHRNLMFIFICYFNACMNDKLKAQFEYVEVIKMVILWSKMVEMERGRETYGLI